MKKIYFLFFILLTGACSMLQGPFEYNEDQNQSYTLTFLNHDKTTFKKTTIKEKHYATPPKEKPEKDDEDYEFVGWYLDEECKTIWDYINNPIISDLVLYPKFIEAPYEIEVTDYTSKSITIKWVYTSFNATTTHEIYQGDSLSSITTKVGTITSSSPASFTITGLTRGTEYFFKITSSNNTESTILAFTPEYRWRKIGNAPWAARFGHRITKDSSGTLWLTGGNAGSSNYKSDLWKSTDGVTWTKISENAGYVKRTIHGFVAMGTDLYVFGGLGADLMWDCKKSSNGGSSWTGCGLPWGTHGSNEIPRDYFAYLTHGSKIYVFGGWDGLEVSGKPAAVKNDVFRYNGGTTWKKDYEGSESSFPKKRMQHTAEFFQDQVYLIGGQENDVFYNNMDMVTLDTYSSWGHRGNLKWQARGCHASIVFDNKLWVIGGYGEGDTYFNDVFFSSNGIGWTEIKNKEEYTPHAMWSKRSDFQLAEVGGKVYLYGGYTEATGVSNEIWVME